MKVHIRQNKAIISEVNVDSFIVQVQVKLIAKIVVLQEIK